MKNTLLVLLFIVGVVSIGTSQLSLRPQVGVNSPSISEDLQVGNWDSSVGFQFGADLQIGSTLYFQAGLNFQTAKLSIEDIGGLDVSNINIPAYVGYKFGESGENKAFGFRLFAGPNFTLKVSEDLDDAINEINTDNIKSFRISGAAGAGIDISILFVDVIYNFGLTDFIEGDAIDNSKKNIFLINAGIRLGF